MSDVYAGKNPWARCPCGHMLWHHDFQERPDDGTLLCCVEGCEQVGCPRSGYSDGDAMSDLTELVKQHHYTGCYGAAHLRVQQPTYEEMRSGHQAPPLSPFDSLGQLMSIPIVVDEEVPDGEFRLVDNSTGEILATGRATQVGGGE